MIRLAVLFLLPAAVLSLLPAPARANGYPGAIPDLRVARGSKGITEAWLADATPRYSHFVLGARYEAGTLAVRLASGGVRRLTLPERAVFEDRQPRLADLDNDGKDEIVVVRSEQGRGASLVVVGLKGDRLQIIAQGPPTGRQNTWLNPAGIADFDGDGRLDIAYVQMPHVLGMLRILALKGGRLVEIASVPDTSNHVAGSRELGLSAVADFDGDGYADLAVPTLDRRSLRFLAFRGGVREIARKPLPAPAARDFAVDGGKRPVVLVGLSNGTVVRVGP